MINELFAVSTSSLPNCEDSPRNFVPINQFLEERRASRLISLQNYSRENTRSLLSFWNPTNCVSNPRKLPFDSVFRVDLRWICTHRVSRCTCQKSWHAHVRKPQIFSKFFTSLKRSLIFPHLLFFSNCAGSSNWLEIRKIKREKSVSLPSIFKPRLSSLVKFSQGKISRFYISGPL